MRFRCHDRVRDVRVQNRWNQNRGFLDQETYRSRHGRLLLDATAQSARDPASFRNETRQRRASGAGGGSGSGTCLSLRAGAVKGGDGLRGEWEVY